MVQLLIVFQLYFTYSIGNLNREMQMTQNSNTSDPYPDYASPPHSPMQGVDDVLTHVDDLIVTSHPSVPNSSSTYPIHLLRRGCLVEGSNPPSLNPYLFQDETSIPEYPPLGIDNPGSGCYVICCIQALIHVPPLYKYFIGCFYKLDNCQEKEYPALMEELFSSLRVPPVTTRTRRIPRAEFPTLLVGTLLSEKSAGDMELGSGGQEDATAFLYLLLDKVCSCILLTFRVNYQIMVFIIIIIISS
jgi:hypothetical protein